MLFFNFPDLNFSSCQILTRWCDWNIHIMKPYNFLYLLLINNFSWFKFVYLHCLGFKKKFSFFLNFYLCSHKRRRGKCQWQIKVEQLRMWLTTFYAHFFNYFLVSFFKPWHIEKTSIIFKTYKEVVNATSSLAFSKFLLF